MKKRTAISAIRQNIWSQVEWLEIHLSAESIKLAGRILLQTWIWALVIPILLVFLQGWCSLCSPKNHGTCWLCHWCTPYIFAVVMAFLATLNASSRTFRSIRDDLILPDRRNGVIVFVQVLCLMLQNGWNLKC